MHVFLSNSINHFVTELMRRCWGVEQGFTLHQSMQLSASNVSSEDTWVY